MDYKEPHNLTGRHIVFQKALELVSFDETSTDVVDQFLAQLKPAPIRTGPTDQQVVVQALDDLSYLRFLQRTNARLEVTQKARDWGRVFQIRLDGTFEVFGSTVDEHAWPTFMGAIHNFSVYLQRLGVELATHLSGEHTTPNLLWGLMCATKSIKSLSSFPDHTTPLSIYQEAAVLACRGELLRLREHKENLEIRARDRQVLDGTQCKIEHLQSILAIPGLSAALTTHTPRVTDYVNVGVIEQGLSGRATDEKFGILTAPTLFSFDYSSIAEGAFSRDRSFAVGFIDIDNFKVFNGIHLETVVDQDMLPYFMRALEAYCHGRAVAYRQGGDEYLVILRNADNEESRTFFEGLQGHIAKINYPDSIPAKPTVSIGVHVIDGNHEVTVFEAKKLANEAKDKAKKSGRNCVRFSTDPWPDAAAEAPTPPQVENQR